MGFFSRIVNALRGSPSSDSSRYISIYVLSHRCREPIMGQIDIMNEVSLADDPDSGYFVRKVLHTSGRNRCFGQVEIDIWLDRNKQVSSHEVQGGRWLTAAEYEAEVARQAAEEAAAAQAAAEAEAQPENGVETEPKPEQGDNPSPPTAAV